MAESENARRARQLPCVTPTQIGEARPITHIDDAGNPAFKIDSHAFMDGFLGSAPFLRKC